MKELDKKQLKRRSMLKKSVMAVPVIHVFRVSELSAVQPSGHTDNGNHYGWYK